jgi:c-di-AMP phosphodiesterase-like protein
MKRTFSSPILNIILGALVLIAIEMAGYFFINRSVEYLILIVVLTVVAACCLAYYMKRQAESRIELIQKTSLLADNTLNATLDHLPVGILKFNPKSQEIEWFNPYLELMFTQNQAELTASRIMSIVDKIEKNNENHVTIGDKKYEINYDDEKHILYFIDVSGEVAAKNRAGQSRPVIGVISVDNYDDATDLITESERTVINGFITKTIDQFASDHKIFTRRINSDRYYFFTNYSTLRTLMAEKFKMTEEFKQLTSENNNPLTFSIGISYGLDDFASIGKTALNNLELALVRGGDQVVVKENLDAAKPIYFGGNSASRMQRSRTRARAISTALKTIVKESESVFIVGHRYPDMDALGAAVAMKFFADANDTKAYVVYDKEQMLPDVQRAIDQLNANSPSNEYIIDVKTAMHLVKDNSLLVMVDHSKIGQTLNQDFYEQFAKVVVIDHHRRDSDFPEQALLSYIESGASSASELITEILQYLPRSGKKMPAVDASVIMAGIQVDTKGFSKGTTARTFDAASYLRTQGADNVLIKQILAKDFTVYKRVNQLVLHATLNNKVAIAAVPSDEIYSTQEIAMAADTLLDMAGVEASFTLTNTQAGYVGISARSKSSVNVQRIMEHFGGGGHFNQAAAQVYEKTIDQVIAELNEVLQGMVIK